MQDPMKQAQARNAGLVETRVNWARKGDDVWENCFSRIDRLERAVVQLAERLARGTKLTGAAAEIAGGQKN